ncbi:M20 family peptidase [Brevundimonas sp.]|uniref:M20 family peptidase n=1 Tax=Brevundimonas sp. TaxID=1871086 RepID=UPI0025C35615|nr:M20 family peptidase [Brevundimonas sp.]
MRRKGWTGRLLAVVGIIVAALALLIAVLVVRTLMLKPAALATAQAPAVVAFDVDQAAQRLGQAIRFETVSHQDRSENDLSQWTAFHDWMAQSYPAFHAAAKRETVGEGALIWTWTGRNPQLQSIILMAHQDVVPASPETLSEWKTPPFSGAVVDGAVWGRGAIDDKGSLIALLEAGEALAKAGRQPERTIIVVSGHDEEVQGSGAKAVAEVLKARNIRAWFVLDEGSAIIEDHPAIKGPAALIAVAEKGYVTLKVTAKGQGGHASAPPQQTAVSTLARAITAIEGKAWPLRYDGPTREGLRELAPYAPFSTRLFLANDWLFGGVLAKQLASNPSAAAGMHTTIAPTMLTGSPKENVLPQTASVWINYRIAPGGSVQSVLDRAKAATKGLPVEITAEGGGRDPSPISSSQSDAYRYLATALGQEAPATPIAPSLMIAGSDSRSLVSVADYVYRFAPNRFHMGELGMVHGVNEHMTLDNLERNIRFYARLMAGEAHAN